MTYLPGSAHDLLARQHGLITTDQLARCGLTHNQIRHLAAMGALASVVRGVYRSPSVRLDECGRCAALCLARPHVAVSGPTAGRLWGFRRVNGDARIHVIGPPGSRPAIAPWVVTYRTAAIRPGDIVERDDGIRLTTQARTVMDLARILEPAALLSVMEQAMHEGRLSPLHMRDVAVVYPGRRPASVRTYLELIDQRLPGGPAESEPEIRVGQALRRRGVKGLVRQYEIRLRGFGAARFDLAVPDIGLAIEVDVHPTHAETGGITADERRDRAAKRVGWVVARIDRPGFEHHFESSIAPIVAIYTTLSLRRLDHAPPGPWLT